MARQKKFATDDLKKYVMEYAGQYPGDPVTPPKVGRYLRDERHIDIGDYLLRRDKEVMALMESLNSNTEEDIKAVILAYHPLDVEAFLRNYPSREKLKTALSKKDAEYARTVKITSKLLEENDALNNEIKTYQSKINTLTRQMNQCNAQKEVEIRKDYEGKIKKLMKLMEEYVYPDVANSLLEKAGLLDLKSTLIDTEKLEQKTVHGNTDITAVDAESAAKEATKDVTDENGNDGNGEEMNGAVSDLLKGFD